MYFMRILKQYSHRPQSPKRPYLDTGRSRAENHWEPSRFFLFSNSNLASTSLGARHALRDQGRLPMKREATRMAVVVSVRRRLVRLRTAVVPLVKVCRKPEHGDLVAIDDEMQPLSRDVSDHLLRVQDEIDAVREVLAFAFKASLMLGQSQQTVITRRLAA